MGALNETKPAAKRRGKSVKQTEDAAYEREVAHADARRAELLASDPSIRSHRDELPTRAFYSIRLRRESYGGGFSAHLVPWDMELLFRKLYGDRSDGLWSYEPPPGAYAVYADGEEVEVRS